MKELPAGMVPYKRTAVFTEDTIPAGLLRKHTTRAGTWATIVVLSGRLRYRILVDPVEEHELEPGRAGIVEDGTPHEVAPLGAVSFYVEFYRRAAKPAGEETPTMDALVEAVRSCPVTALDAAIEALVAIGLAAQPALLEVARLAGSPAVRARAREAIAAILIHEGARPTPQVSWRAGETLHAVLERMSRTFGLVIEPGHGPLDVPVKAPGHELHAFEALDRLCEHTDRRWSPHGPGGVHIKRQPPIPYPAAYSGSFRLRVLELEARRKTDFVGSTLHAELAIVAGRDQLRWVLGRYGLEELGAEDDLGNALDVRVASHMPSRGVKPFHEVERCVLSGFAPAASAIRNLRGALSIEVGTRSIAMMVPRPAKGATYTAGAYTLHVLEAPGDGFVVAFERESQHGAPIYTAEGKRALWRHALVMDDEGRELVVQDVQVREIFADLGRGGKSVHYRLHVPDLAGREAAWLRLRFITDSERLRVPFCFENIPLP